jgi:catechol 2,3-dioxygenase-like lactoylglutathione lyase family enzyme
VNGRFLELSIVTPDIRASLEFYGKLGFSEAEVGHAWDHPYAVLNDGRICVGLHQQPSFEPSITFVKPGLLKHLAVLERLGLKLEFRRLAADVFNEVGWCDPSGHLIRLVEARTFSPVERPLAEVSLCGYFVEIALPTAHRDAAKAHWEQLGFVAMDEFDAMLPHVSCTSDTIDIGLYEPAQVQGLTLVFEVQDLAEALLQLDAVGIAPNARVPAPLRQIPAAVLTAPEGTAILLSARSGS